MTAYVAAIAGSYKRMLRARSGIVSTTSFYAMLLVAWGSIWWAATRAVGGSVDGYGFENIFWYLAATEAAVIVVQSRKVEIIGEEIGAGVIETEMLRPTSVVGIRIAMEVGEALARLSVVTPVGFTLGFLYTRTVPDVLALITCAPALVLAVMVNVVAVHAFAALSFWVRDSKAAWFLFQKMIFLLGGMLIPLQFMPQVMTTVAWTLPFWPMAYAPGRLASGAFEPWLLAGQLMWLTTLLFIAHGLFALGQRRVQRGLV